MHVRESHTKEFNLSTLLAPELETLGLGAAATVPWCPETGITACSWSSTWQPVRNNSDVPPISWMLRSARSLRVLSGLR